MTTACRSSPARSRRCSKVRFRTLGCYPLTGAIESDATTLAGHHPGNAARRRNSERQGRVIDHDARRLDGEEEAGRLFLMAHSSITHRRGHPQATSRSHEHKSLLRFITCGSVDDGKSTLIGRLLYESKLVFEDQLAALEADSKKVGTQGERTRLRAAGRRPRRRARAGHHHRRRVSLLLDRQAQVHRRRHAGPRAVHAQHGDGRLDRRSRRDPDRCAQGRADADAPAQLHRLAARHPARGRSPSTRWTWSTTRRTRSTRSSPTTARSPRRSA